MVARVRYVESLLWYDMPLIFEGVTDAGSPVVGVLTDDERDGWDVYAAAVVDRDTLRELEANRLPLRDVFTARRHGAMLYGTLDRNPAFFRPGPDMPDELLPESGYTLHPPESENQARESAEGGP